MVDDFLVIEWLNEGFTYVNKIFQENSEYISLLPLLIIYSLKNYLLNSIKSYLFNKYLLNNPITTLFLKNINNFLLSLYFNIKYNIKIVGVEFAFINLINDMYTYLFDENNLNITRYLYLDLFLYSSAFLLINLTPAESPLLFLFTLFFFILALFIRLIYISYWFIFENTNNRDNISYKVFLSCIFLLLGILFLFLIVLSLYILYFLIHKFKGYINKILLRLKSYILKMDNGSNNSGSNPSGGSGGIGEGSSGSSQGGPSGPRPGETWGPRHAPIFGYDRDMEREISRKLSGRMEVPGAYGVLNVNVTGPAIHDDWVWTNLTREESRYIVGKAFYLRLSDPSMNKYGLTSGSEYQRSKIYGHARIAREGDLIRRNVGCSPFGWAEWVNSSKRNLKYIRDKIVDK